MIANWAVIGRKLTALATITAFIVTQTAADADTISDAGAAGQAFGTSITPSATSLGSADGTGTVTLFPDSSNATTLSASQLFPGAAAGNNSGLAQAYSAGTLEGVGISAQQSLDTDTTSSTGQAYQTVIASKNVSAPDLTNDPIWTTTDSTMTNLASIAQTFSDCMTSTTYTPTTRTVHVPDYHVCDKVNDFSGNYTVPHQYTAGLFQITGGNGMLESCPSGRPNCEAIVVGQVGDNYWTGGGCTEFDWNLSVQISNPAAIVSATLTTAEDDDYSQIIINNSVAFQDFTGALPTDTGSTSCDRRTNHFYTPETDWTRYFQAGGNLALKDRIDVGGDGEGYFTIEVIYDPTKLVQDQGWPMPAGAQNAETGINDHYCSGSYRCTAMPQMIQTTAPAGCVSYQGGTYCPAADHTSDTCISYPVQISSGRGGSSIEYESYCRWTSSSTDCTEINGFEICADQMHPSPFAGISPFCESVSMTATCNFYQGPLPCYTDAEGHQQCPVNTGGDLDECASYESDSSCGYISTQCLQGSTGVSGECYIQELTYDCGNNVSVPSATSTQTMSCSGPVRCMGSDCVSVSGQTNSDFATVTASLQAAEQIMSDRACVQGGVCTVFNGTAGMCKQAAGGLVDCCNKPTGISLSDYVALLMAARKVDGALGAPIGSQLQGAWETVQQAGTDVWSDVSQPFDSALNSLTGQTASSAAQAGVTDATSQAGSAAASGLLASTEQELMRSTAQWTADTFGAGAANAMFQVVPSAGSAAGPAVSQAGGQVAQGTVQFASTLATAASVIMWAYTIYSVSMILIQLIWSCETSEFELDAHRQLKACHYIGSYCSQSTPIGCAETEQSYCCYNAPLSRILQEQIRPQLGLTFGTPQIPQCGGLTIPQLQTVNWSNIDLSEWIGILAETGNLPTTSSITMTNVTGTGNALAAGAGGVRAGSAATIHDQANQIDINSLRNQATSELNSQLGPH